MYNVAALHPLLSWRVFEQEIAAVEKFAHFLSDRAADAQVGGGGLVQWSMLVQINR